MRLSPPKMERDQSKNLLLIIIGISKYPTCLFFDTFTCLNYLETYKYLNGCADLSKFRILIILKLLGGKTCLTEWPFGNNGDLGWWNS